MFSTIGPNGNFWRSWRQFIATLTSAEATSVAVHGVNFGARKSMSPVSMLR